MIILEVMDKEPPLVVIIVPLIFAGITAYLLCLWKPKACIATLLCCALISIIMTSEVLNEFVGPAIRHEDPVYWYASILIALACCLAPLVGSIQSLRRTNGSPGTPRVKE